MACAALLAITPPRPDLLLRTARICLKLRRPRQAYDAAARVNPIDVRGTADLDRTAEQMTEMAAALCTWGLRVEATDVLRNAHALAPHAAAPRSALASSPAGGGSKESSPAWGGTTRPRSGAGPLASGPRSGF